MLGSVVNKSVFLLLEAWFLLSDKTYLLIEVQIMNHSFINAPFSL